MLQITLAAFALVPMPQGKGGAAMNPMRQLLGSFSFDKLDANKDVFLSPDEVTQATFDWLDRNHDKSLDLGELAKLPAERSAGQTARENEQDRKDKKEQEKDKEKDKEKEKGRDADKKKGGEPKDEGASGNPAKDHLARMDANKDGKVSRAEFSLPEGWWNQVDADRDGRISKDEFLNKAKRDEKDAKKKGIQLANMTPEEAFAELDANQDGMVSADEWSMNPGLFEKVDADGDGSLSKEEVAKAVAALKQMLKGRGAEGGGDAGDGGETAKKKKGGKSQKPAEPKPGEDPPL